MPVDHDSHAPLPHQLTHRACDQLVHVPLCHEEQVVPLDQDSQAPLGHSLTHDEVTQVAQMPLDQDVHVVPFDHDSHAPLGHQLTQVGRGDGAEATEPPTKAPPFTETGNEACTHTQPRT
eukprot:2461545-Prymnesium_polylepis.1